LKSLTIQVRLTAWYFLSLAIIVVIFAGGSWFAMKASMYHSIDRDLRYRIVSVVPFIESHSLNTREQFTKVFAKSRTSNPTSFTNLTCCDRTACPSFLRGVLMGPYL